MIGSMIVDFPLLALALFAATYMIRYFDGPFGILKKLRKAAGVRSIAVHDSDIYSTDIVGYKESVDDTWIAGFVSCHWCMTTWLCAFAFAAYAYAYGYSVLDFVVLTLAGIAVSGTLHNVVSR